MRVFDVWLYVLVLADGSRYVGWTTNVRKRVWAHMKGKGAKITRECKPRVLEAVLSLGEVLRDEAVEAEAIVALELVKLYGIGRVRGSDVISARMRASVDVGIDWYIDGAKRRAIMWREYREYGGYCPSGSCLF